MIKWPSDQELWKSCVDLHLCFPHFYSRPIALLNVSLGWHGLLYKYGPELEKETLRVIEESTGEEFDRTPVFWSAKEKYGRLDISILSGTELMWDIISKIEDESLETCEVCGKKATTTSGRSGWYSTLCEFHTKERDQ
jgi:hypothetical protein